MARKPCPICGGLNTEYVGTMPDLSESWICHDCPFGWDSYAFGEPIDDPDAYDPEDDWWDDEDDAEADEYYSIPFNFQKERVVDTSSGNVARYYRVTGAGYCWGEIRSKRAAYAAAQIWANMTGRQLYVTKWNYFNSVHKSGHKDTVYPTRSHRSPRSRRPIVAADPTDQITLDDIPF